MNLSGLAMAQGLQDEDRPLVRDLITVLNRNYPKHEKRRRYYDDKVDIKSLGIRTPKKFKGIKSETGWAAKAVDMLAERSVINGATMDGDRTLLDEIIEYNNLWDSYQMSVPSMLIYGCGFWSVTLQEKKAVINFRDAQTASALWDWKHKRIKAGLVVEAFDKFTNRKALIPSVVTIHTDTHFIVCTRNEMKTWEAEYKEHEAGRPLIEPMTYKQRIDRPFGSSRISKCCMRIIDSMQRELMRTEFHSELFSSPTKYLLGLDDEQYEEVQNNKLEAYLSEYIISTRDPETGQVPTIGMLQQQSMEPHLALMDKLANQMASETSCPASTFGVTGNGYISSDALRASSDDLIIEARTLNKHNGVALRNVLLMALAVAQNKPLDQLSEDELSLSIRWGDEAMQSAAAIADAMLKIASVVPGFAGSEMFWQKQGYSEDEIKRVMSEVKVNQSKEVVAQLLGGKNENSNTDVPSGGVQQVVESS